MRKRGEKFVSHLRVLRVWRHLLPLVRDQSGVLDVLLVLRRVPAGGARREDDHRVRPALREENAMGHGCGCGMSLEQAARTRCHECGTETCRSCSIQFDATTFCRWCATTSALARPA
ncbi:MAG: hypothetical protein ACRDF6_08365 [bacterium]